MNAERPPELPNGQDDPPDLVQALKVAARLLREIHGAAVLTDDQRLRAWAIRRVLRRLIEAHREG